MRSRGESAVWTVGMVGRGPASGHQHSTDWESAVSGVSTTCRAFSSEVVGLPGLEPGAHGLGIAQGEGDGVLAEDTEDRPGHPDGREAGSCEVSPEAVISDFRTLIESIWSTSQEYGADNAPDSAACQGGICRKAIFLQFTPGLAASLVRWPDEADAVPEIIVGEVGISLRQAEVAVPEVLLQAVEIEPVLDCPRAEGVPKR